MIGPAGGSATAVPGGAEAPVPRRWCQCRCRPRRTAGQARGLHRRAGGVRVGPGEHQVDVVPRVVVAEDRAAPVLLVAQVAVAGAEVGRGRHAPRRRRRTGRPVPSPSPSRPQTAQDEGMNCIGPTARSQVVSPSQRPPSVSGMAATSPTPFELRPEDRTQRAAGLRSTAPPDACPDSTCRCRRAGVQDRWQAGSLSVQGVPRRSGRRAAPGPAAPSRRPAPARRGCRPARGRARRRHPGRPCPPGRSAGGRR